MTGKVFKNLCPHKSSYPPVPDEETHSGYLWEVVIISTMNKVLGYRVTSAFEFQMRDGIIYLNALSLFSSINENMSYLMGCFEG